MPEEVGGIVGTVSLETGNIDAAAARLKAAMDEVEGKMQGLVAALAAGSMSAAEFATQTRTLAAEKKNLATAASTLEGMQRAEAAAQAQATAATQTQVAATAQAIGSSNAWGAAVGEATAIQTAAAATQAQATQAQVAAQAQAIGSATAWGAAVGEASSIQTAAAAAQAQATAATQAQVAAQAQAISSATAWGAAVKEARSIQGVGGLQAQIARDEAQATEQATAAWTAAGPARRAAAQVIREQAFALQHLEEAALHEAIAATESATATTRLNTAMPAMSQGMVAAGMGTKNTAMQMLILGQVVDDVQYGFRAIVNQIPMAVMAFGGGAALAGQLSIAGVAVNQLIMHWDDLAKLMGSTSNQMMTQADHMEALGKNTHKTAEETRALAAAQREQAAVTQLLTQGTKAEGATASAVAESIAGAGVPGPGGMTGGQRIRQGLMQQIREEMSPTDPSMMGRARAQERLAGMEQTLASPTAMSAMGQAASEFLGAVQRQRELVAKFNDSLTAEVGRRADQTLAASLQDPSQLLGMVQKRPELYEPDTAGRLGRSGQKKARENEDFLIQVFDEASKRVDMLRDRIRETTDHMGKVFKDMQEEDDKKRDIARESTDHMGDVFEGMVEDAIKARHGIDVEESPIKRAQRMEIERDDAARREGKDPRLTPHQQAAQDRETQRALDRNPAMQTPVRRTGEELEFARALERRKGDMEKARQDLQADLYKELIGMKVPPAAAQKMAKERSTEAMRGVTEDVMNRAMGGGEVKQGQSMSIDQFERSVKAMSGGDPNGRRLELIKDGIARQVNVQEKLLQAQIAAAKNPKFVARKPHR